MTTLDDAVLEDEVGVDGSVSLVCTLPCRVREFDCMGETVAAFVEPGCGRPVVFLHGNSSTKAVWEYQIPLVRRLGRPMLALDLPGHGQSKNARAPERIYSFPGYAAVVSDLISTIGWSEVDIVGWSLGGHIGLQLLATDKRICSLLIVGTPPVPLCAESLVAAFHPSDTMALASKREFSDADAFAYGVAMMGGPQFLTASLLANVKRTDGAARQLLFASALGGVGIDQRHAAETINRPLCVVHGEREPFVRFDYLQRLNYRALWNGRINVIPGSGHAPHRQHPAAFNSNLLDFLRTPNPVV